MVAQEAGSRTQSKYEIIRTLGAGGMAEVLLARQTGAAGFEKLVALKRLLIQRQQDPVFVKSLINEARLASQLSHPNIVQVFDFEVIDQFYCLVMEFIDGLTLEDVLNLCRVRGIGVPQSLLHYIASELCAGLQYLHSATTPDGTPLLLVHRDIKPSNIMLAFNGQVKLLDFGVAKASTNLYRTTVGGGAKGTLAFMSPEQLSGETVGPTSDLFSLGVTLFESSTLSPLFDDRNLVKHTQELYLGLRPDARALLEHHNPALVPIVERMIQPSTEERFQTALEVRTSLRPLTEGHGSLELSEWLRGLVPSRAGQSATEASTSADPISPRDQTLAFDSASEAYLQSSLRSDMTSEAIDALTPSLPGSTLAEERVPVDGTPVQITDLTAEPPSGPEEAPPVDNRRSNALAADATTNLPVRHLKHLTGIQKGLAGMALGLLVVTVSLMVWRYALVARSGAPATVATAASSNALFSAPANTPAPSRANATVSITSDPTGTIYIGGQDRGGRYEGILPPGRHQVLIQTEGGKHKMFIIDAKAGQTLEYFWSFHEKRWLKGRD